MKNLSLVILCLSIFSLDIFANTLHIPYDYYHLQDAIDAANEGDTILVAPGTYSDRKCNGGLMIENKSIHIISEAGPEVTIIANACPDYLVGVRAFSIRNVENNCTISGFSMIGHYGVYDPFDTGIEWQTIEIYESVNVTISNNIFRNNYNYNVIETENTSSTTIEYNVFYGNSRGRPPIKGGTIIEIQNNSSPIIRFNTFAENHSDIQINLVANNSYPVIHNNIIVNNHGYGISSLAPSGNITIECNDVWNNSSGSYSGTIADLTGINGNISVDPLFCGIPASYNYYLQLNSPCVESNVPEHCNELRIGAYPVNCTVDVDNTSWGKLKSVYKK